jgi:hypothetical protein
MTGTAGVRFYVLGPPSEAMLKRKRFQGRLNGKLHLSKMRFSQPYSPERRTSDILHSKEFILTVNRGRRSRRMFWTVAMKNGGTLTSTG